MRAGAPNAARTDARQPATGKMQPAKRRPGGVWKSRHASIVSAGQLAVAQLGSGWRLLLGVGVGILVAVVLISTVPLYDDLMTNVQLQATINQEGDVSRNLEIAASANQFTAALAHNEDASVRANAARYIGAFTQADVTNYYAADPMLISTLGAQRFNVGSTAAVQVTFEAFDYASAQSHMRLIAGIVPQSAGASGAPAAYEALITRQMADQLQAKVGEVLKGIQFGAHNRSVTARIVGIWEPTQAEDPFWNGRSFEAGGSESVGADYPVLLTKGALVSAVSALPDLSVGQHWVYYTAATRINTGNMTAVQRNIGLLRAHLLSDLTAQGAQILVNTGLDSTIRSVQQQLALLTLPLYIVVAQVVGLALLFVLAMAGLLIEGQTGGIATLKSRGASAVQLLGSFAVQGMLLGIVAAAVGPLLAGVLALALVRAFVPAATLTSSGASSSYLVSLSAPQTVALPALAGALLGVGAVIAATQRATRLDVLAFRREQGRATRQPLWRRYYLDIGLAVLCALGYLELGQFGGIATRAQLSQGSSSPLLLAAPALLLLAGTLLLLRVFPAVADLGARWASRGNGATGMLAMAQVARSPAGPSRLMLLLALAVGLGLFALTYDASLIRSAADRAGYQAGADVRLVETSSLAPKQNTSVISQLAGLPGVEGVTPVYRADVNTTFDEGYNSANLLGLDPKTWATAAGTTSWRDDYAATPLPALMDGLRQHQYGDDGSDQAGQTLAGSASHPIWSIVSDTFASAQHVQVGDRFALNLPGASSTSSFFVVGAIVRDFPTLYSAKAPGGFLVANLYDCVGAIQAANAAATSQAGPNEYWLKTSADGRQQTAISNALTSHAAAWNIDHVVDRRALEATIGSNPIQAGMRGLLLVGALTAGALAVLGAIVQSALAARQRGVQFAVLRTLGMTARQLAWLLLGEQLLVYLFGLLGGTALGVVLATATLPFLQFGDSTIDPTTLGVPPYVLVVNPSGLAWFYLLLAAAFAVALVIGARYAAHVGLGKTLRLGED